MMYYTEQPILRREYKYKIRKPQPRDPTIYVPDFVWVKDSAWDQISIARQTAYILNLSMPNSRKRVNFFY